MAVFSCLGFFVAVSKGTLEGGIPFLPAAWNQTLGRFMYGGGALITAVAALWFFRRALQKKSPTKAPDSATSEPAPGADIYPDV